MAIRRCVGLQDVLGMTGTLRMRHSPVRRVYGPSNGIATRSWVTTVESIGDEAITTIEAINQTSSGTRFKNRSCLLKSSKAATVSRARSCPLPRSSRANHIPQSPILTTRCPATSAGVAPTFVFAKPLNMRQSCLDQEGADHDLRSVGVYRADRHDSARAVKSGAARACSLRMGSSAEILCWAASRQLGIQTRYARRGSPCAKPVFIRIGREAAT